MPATVVPDEARKALDKAKIRLMATPDTTFFTTVLFSLRHIWDDQIPTACTNGRWIRYNPEFFMKCSPDERVGLMLHETFHVVWMHMLRLNERDPAKWNVATDFVINLYIKDLGFKLPAGGLLDEQYRDMTADEVYAILPDPDPDEVEMHLQLGDGPDSEGGGDGDGNDPQQGPEVYATNEAEAKAIEQELQDVLIRAMIQSQAAGDKPGTIPGEVELYINRLLKPKLPTATVLRKYLFDMNKEDYTWTRPNRRYFPDYYLPSLHSEALGHIAVFVDASASVTDDEFLRFVSEVGGVIRQMRPKKITLVSFDTCIQTEQDVTSLAELSRATFKGRGGTEIEPVMEWCRERQPKVALIFTDGHFHFYEHIEYPKHPLVWLVHDNSQFKAPHGKVMHYAMDD